VKVTIQTTTRRGKFDSYDLDREQVIPGNGIAVIYLGP